MYIKQKELKDLATVRYYEKRFGSTFKTYNAM